MGAEHQLQLISVRSRSCRRASAVLVGQHFPTVELQRCVGSVQLCGDVSHLRW